MNKKRSGSILVLLTLMTFLSGCQLLDDFFKDSPPKEVPVKTQPEYQPIEIPEIKSTYEYNKSDDWKPLIEPLVDELIATTTQIGEGKVLMLGDAVNQTAERYNLNSFQSVLYRQLTNQSIYKVIPYSAVVAGKQDIGIAVDDPSISRAKLLGLARYLKADFILYSYLKENRDETDQTPELFMELINAKTGEINWRFNSSQIVQE